MRYARHIILLVIFSFSIAAQAGIIVKSVERSGQKKIEMETTMMVDQNKLRIESNEKDEQNVVIFRGDKKVFWVLKTSDKTYVEMTQEDLAELKAQMDNMQKMMAEQMKNMPEEQRKMMEKMMPSAAGAAKKMKTDYKKKGSGEKVGKWSCDHYEGFRDGKKTGELWTASWDQIGLKRSDMSAFKQMAEFFEAISQDASEFMKIGSEEWEKEQGLSGVPVRWIDMEDGQTDSQGEIKEIRKQDIKASLFDIPSGYEKEDNPWKDQGAGMTPY